MLTLTTGDSGTIAGTVDANLTGATARVNIKRPDKTTISKNATIGAALDGEWSITYAGTDLTSTGLYYLEVEVTFSNGSPQTFCKTAEGDRLLFSVREQIA